MNDRATFTPATAPATVPTAESWLSGLPAEARPDVIAGLVAHADVVGLGTSTREARETFLLAEHVTRALIRRGFRTIAVVDDQRVGESYDRFVRGEDIDIDAALAQAWGPWRTAEMRQALTWLRERNRGHPQDPVGFVAVDGSGVLPGDYDRVIELIGGQDRAVARRVGERLDVIRVAHEDGEHVQRARGTHPGTPFVEFARAARETAGRLPGGSERDEALRLLDAIVDHHANAVGVGYDAAREERAAAERLLAHHRRGGDRIVLWEGSAHVAAHRGVMLGSHLHQALGDGYAGVHITFGHGRIARMDIPLPRPDSLEGALLASGRERVVDVRGELPADSPIPVDRPWRTRLISGVYDPARDEEHYYDLPSLAASFDVVAFLPTITPAGPLPSTAAPGPG